jgi:hypothetical protein
MKKLLAFIVLFIIAASVLTLMDYFKKPRPVITGPTGTLEESNSDGRVRGSEESSIKIGTTKEIAGLSVTLNDLTDDFRCGGDNCPEYGGVTVNVTLKSGEEVVTRNMASDEVPIEFGGYKISIIKIAPEKTPVELIPKSDYEITFLASPLALEIDGKNSGL